MKKRLIYLLFCFLLLLTACGGEKEDDDRTSRFDMYEDVVLEEVRAASKVNAQYIITGCPLGENNYSEVTWIDSQEALDDYYKQYKEMFFLGRREQTDVCGTVGFLNACDRYDEAFWAENELVLVVILEGTSMHRHVVTDVAKTEEGKWVIGIDRLKSIILDGAEEGWHLIIEVPKGQIAEGDQFEVRMRSVQVKEIIYTTQEAQ